MDLIEALCGALEAAKMDESPEGMALVEAIMSSGEVSLMVNDDGSVSLKSGDVSLDVAAEVINAVEGGEMEAEGMGSMGEVAS